MLAGQKFSNYTKKFDKKPLSLQKKDRHYHTKFCQKSHFWLPTNCYDFVVVRTVVG